jgi:hypothetical protein
MRVCKAYFAVVFLITLIFASVTSSQSLTLGSISGRVTDPTGAVIAGATVELKSLDTGGTQVAATGGDGSFRFNLLKPGNYEITTGMIGFAKTVRPTSVEVGQTSQVDIALEISKTAETIEVSGEAPLISTEPGMATSFTPQEVALLPAAGGDLTTIAFTAPGVVVSQGMGYGNFTVNGLSGTSNLYTVNGENDMDPYFNINNSGASNLTLGSNEVQEATVVTNPYSAQYGQLSGAQVNYVTKSGTNSFHGNAQWYWNGRYMNSNDFIANASGAPRPFSNANQWAASFGGPIIKDHTWFFVDTEGLRFVLPNVDVVTIPTPAFASAVLANVQNVAPGEAAAYQNMFNIYSAAAAGKQASPVPVAGTQCDGIAVPGFASGAPCQENVTLTPTSFAKEWILAGRIDQKLTTRDDLFFRFKLDYGLQPTAINPLSSAFDANSNQPAYDYQANLRHVFSASATNAFTATVSHYVALFTQDVSAWQKEFPYGGVAFAGDVGFSGINSSVGNFPQGRNITQYQFIDDFSLVRGKHSMKFGVNFRRYDVSDHNFFNVYPTSTFGDLSSKTYGASGMTGLQAFVNGTALSYQQAYSPSTDVPIGIWGTGFYVEDQWKVKPNFTLMGALRFEHNANPTCNTNCFANYNAPFNELTSVQAGPAGAGDVPYSSDIHSGLRHPYMSVDAINVSPRVSFSWAPEASDHFPFFRGGNKTVISGGIGIFYDNPPAGMLDQELGNPGNPPATTLFTIEPLDSAGTGTTGIAPFTAGPAAFKAASSAFTISKSYNQLSAILDPIIGYNPPVSFNSIQGTIHSPQAQEWNLKVDQEITKSVAVSLNYVGNHAINIPYFNSWWNALATNSVFANVAGVKTAATVLPNYGDVTTLQSGAVSNYNGVTASVRVQYHNWFMGHFNYTFSHTLDETSNGGLFPIGGWPDGFNIQTQVNPGSLRANNYGNADYDVRNLFNADYVITPPMHFENRFLKAAFGGWQWSGKVFARSGLPYTVLDANAFGDLAYNSTFSVVASQIAPGASNSCGVGAVVTNAKLNPCLNASAFANTAATGFAYSSFPNQGRNQYRGPNYFDMDMALFKTFSLKERLNFGLGAQAFNVFNHPNFDPPDTLLGSPQFGQILGMQGVPTSPYGNFLGFDSSVRVVQLSLKLTF